MKKKIAILPLILLLAMCLCVPTYAATVCKIGSKGYSSLQKAINKVKDGQTIKVTKAIKTKEHLDCAGGKAFTIDFSNLKYTCTGEDFAFGIATGTSVKVKNLNMKAIRGFIILGKLTIDSGKMTSGYILVRDKAASLTINGGSFKIKKQGDMGPWIENHGTTKIAKGTFSAQADIRNHGESKLTISGGTFTYSDEHSIIANFNNPTTIIKGGTFKSGDKPAVDNNSGTVKISGGKFYAKYTSVTSSNDGTVSISGGTFTNERDPVVILNGKTTVSGGTFKGGLRFGGKATLKGGKSTFIVEAKDGGKVTVQKFTIDQGSVPPQGPGFGDPIFLADGGKITVKGGSFLSPNGYGYAEINGGKVTGTGSWKKLFQVKTLKYEE